MATPTGTLECEECTSMAERRASLLPDAENIDPSTTGVVDIVYVEEVEDAYIGGGGA